MSNNSRPRDEAIEVSCYSVARAASRCVCARAYARANMQGLWIRHLPRPGERTRRSGGTREGTTHAGPQKGGLIV